MDFRDENFVMKTLNNWKCLVTYLFRFYIYYNFVQKLLSSEKSIGWALYFIEISNVFEP